MKQSAGAVRGQAISTGGRYLGLLLADGTVRIWDLELGVQRPPLKPKGQAQLAVPSPDGRTVAMAISADGVYTLRSRDARRAGQSERSEGNGACRGLCPRWEGDRYGRL